MTHDFNMAYERFHLDCDCASVAVHQASIEALRTTADVQKGRLAFQTKELIETAKEDLLVRLKYIRHISLFADDVNILETQLAALKLVESIMGEPLQKAGS